MLEDVRSIIDGNLLYRHVVHLTDQSPVRGNLRNPATSKGAEITIKHVLLGHCAF
jgi:hypothetical protein